MARMIYVACLAAYNNGILHGRWIETTDASAADIHAEVQAMLKASPIPGAEEWAIHDTDGFGRLVGEYTSFEDVAALSEALEGDHARGFSWLLDCVGLSIAEAAEKADEVAIFESDRFDLAQAYAEEMIEEAYADTLGGLPDLIKHNIDFAGIARDLTVGGDIVEASDAHGAFLVTNANAF